MNQIATITTGNIQLIRNLWATFFYVFTIIAVLIVFFFVFRGNGFCNVMQCLILRWMAFNVYCVESSFVQHERFEAEAIVTAIIAVGSTTYLRRSAHTITTFWVLC